MKVVAATVTFNSSISLEKTIQALLRQTVEVEKIVITDNNSNDENKARLKKIQEEHPDKIHIVWLKSNTGGAGGFYASMKYARKHYDPDWYWLMDDDAYPDDNTLEVLLRKTETLDNIGFVAPVIWGIDKEEYQLYHARKRRGKICRFSPVAPSIDALENDQLIDVDAFVGPLISKNAVQKCGLPRAGCFIEGDDTDYTYRITRLFKGYLVKDTKMNHRDLPPDNGQNPGGWWKQYYWFRNSILFAKHNLKGIDKWIGILYFFYFAYKFKIKMYRNKQLKEYRSFRWKLLRQGLIDGIMGREGARLLPSDYKIKLKQWETTHLEGKENV